MGLFRKKQHHRTAVDETTDSSYQDEDESSKSRRSSGMGKWVCGSNSSKHVLEQDNKISPKNSYSSSTASSQEDKRDDKQGFNVTNTRSASASPRDMDYEDLDNSLISCLPPPAAQAAFDGPPRFDWIDVVSVCFPCLVCLFGLLLVYYYSLVGFLVCLAGSDSFLFPLDRSQKSLTLYFLPHPSGIPRRHPRPKDLSPPLGPPGNGTRGNDDLVHPQPETRAQGQIQLFPDEGG
jgi:hypothetical protein